MLHSWASEQGHWRPAPVYHATGEVLGLLGQGGSPSMGMLSCAFLPQMLLCLAAEQDMCASNPNPDLIWGLQALLVTSCSSGRLPSADPILLCLLLSYNQGYPHFLTFTRRAVLPVRRKRLLSSPSKVSSYQG